MTKHCARAAIFVAVSMIGTVAGARTFSGFVRERGSGEALIGAIVTDAEKRAGATTNSMGFYSITLPDSVIDIKVYYSGYEPVTTKSRGRADIEMDAVKALDELVVVSSQERTDKLVKAGMGKVHLTATDILNTPVIFGESDVIKTLQLQPGVSAGVEGMAGMYVRGGNADENMYMLDNIPLYQVNHFGGLFSAFNSEAIKNVDFYKASYPAKFDGRLSSYVDIRTKDGSLEKHSGMARLGLTSGAFSMNGPIAKGKTTYSVSLRRSWFDVLSVPALAIYNSGSESDDKVIAGYAFTDFNAKINHHFNDRSRAYVMFYYGEDYLKGGSESKDTNELRDYQKNISKLRWGNIVASAGWNYVISPKLFVETTAAFSRYYSHMTRDDEDLTYNENKAVTASSLQHLKYDNNISDWILRADFDYKPASNNHLTFGAHYTYHSFLPSRYIITLTSNDLQGTQRENTDVYRGHEANFYVNDDWSVSDQVRVEAGLHYSLFNADNDTHGQLSPRLSLRYSPTNDLAIKASYSHAVQYVHQLGQSSISLPTDQWLPVTSGFKPQTSDQVSVGAYYMLGDKYSISVEGYYKWLKNLIDYIDEYYLLPPQTAWDSKLTSGKGTAKGIDFMVSREIGKVTGHFSYSLLFADRTFAEKNGGKTYPARFDNRHKFNILLNWKINDKWEANAAWTGMSGNRYTLSLQGWEDPSLGPWNYNMHLSEGINNYRLPFYHRLDLSFTRYTHNGYWTFSAYNVYSNVNVIAIRQDYSTKDYHPTFQYFHLLPIIPSVSYTWQF
jgi:hypothetical protein